MVSRTVVRVGLAALLALLVASAAPALKAPVELGARPGPHASEIMDSFDPIELVADGSINRITGAMASLLFQNEGPFSGTPEQAAKSYLSRHAGIFALSGRAEDLLLDQVQEAPGAQVVRMHQSVNGIRVWNAEVVVTLDETGQYVQTVYSNYDPAVAEAGLSTAAAVDAAQAERIARSAVWIQPDTKLIGEPQGPALWILRNEDRAGSSARLAWLVDLPIEEPMGDWVVFVDAQNGSILRLYDQAHYVDGSGNAFDPDPLTTAEVAYNSPGYTDGNDADTPQLTAQVFDRVLPELTEIAGVYYLRGPWVYIDEFETPVSPPATSTDPNGFHFTRSAQGFEDANVYFLIDQSQRYMQSLGFSTIQHAPIHIDTHGLQGADNSHYLPGANRIAYGEGGVDDAEDADVVLHEYGHSIQTSIVPGWGSSTQARSMGEGFGDYWAGSYSAWRSAYRSEWVFNWDGHNPFWSGRVLNSTLGYSNLNGDIYHDGTIWASCLWLIRNEIGRTVSDTDVLRLHFGIPASASMQQAAQNCMQADRSTYAGLHSGSIDYFFTLRGFFTASQFDVPELTHTPLGEQAGPGPYPLTVTIASTSGIVAGSVKVKFGISGVFDQEAVLNPTGNPNEWGGEIPSQGSNVDIRYYICADNSAGWRGANPRGAEFRYHEFHVLFDPLAVGDSETGQELTLFPANPNPFPAMTALRFQLPTAGLVRMVIHDVSGREVRSLVSSSMTAGSHGVVWDGKDDGGHALPSGLYFVRLNAAEKTLSQKVLLTR